MSSVCRVCKTAINPSTNYVLRLDYFCSTVCKRLDEALKNAGPDETIRLVTFIRTGIDTAKTSDPVVNGYTVTALAEDLINAITKTVRTSAERKSSDV
jgi:hypothetical protein